MKGIFIPGTLLCCLWSSICLTPAFAQVPPEFSDLYPAMQGYLTNFEATLDAGWDGIKMKLGVFYRHEQATRGGRGELVEKVLVGWQGERLELGRRLHWEAQRGGLGRARQVLAVGDGAPWIWNVVGDRWAAAHQLLDFYHASERLWALGEALHPRDEAARRGWPIGSGAVESGCRTRQCRRKRPGQFWTTAGLRHLDALAEARGNGHWDELWLTA
jgi:hypothetical protein